MSVRGGSGVEGGKTDLPSGLMLRTGAAGYRKSHTLMWPSAEVLTSICSLTRASPVTGLVPAWNTAAGALGLPRRLHL